MLDQNLNYRNGARGCCAFLVPLLTMALITAAPEAAAAEDDPYAAENDPYAEEGDPGAAETDPYAEEYPVGPDRNPAGPFDQRERAGDGRAAGQEDFIGEGIQGPRRRDGATARRELLFRDGIEERERWYPEGLQPYAPVERSDLEAYDPRYRGRRAQVLPDTPPGLSVDSFLTAGFQIDDNPLLESSLETLGRDPAAWGFIVQPGISVRRRTPRTLLQSVLSLRYDNLNSFDDELDDRDLDTFNQFFGAQFDLVGRENAINLFTNVSNASSRNQLIEESNVGLTNENTLTYGGGGSYKHALSPNGVIQFSGAIRRQDVDSSSPLLVNTTFYEAAVDYRHLVTSTGALGVGGIYQHFTPDDGLNPNVDVVTGVLSWSEDVSSYLTVYVEAGPQFISSDDVFRIRDSESTVDAHALGMVQWTASARDRLMFRASRSAEPNANGEIRTDNQLELVYFREMTRTISLGVPLRVLFQDSPLDDGFGDRTFFQFNPTLVWAFAPRWGLSTEYRLRVEDQSSLSTATSNAGLISVTYFGKLVP